MKHKVMSTIDNWLEQKKACKDAVKWVKDNRSVLQQKEDEVAKEEFNMESSIYTLEQFIAGGHEQIQWASWYVAEVLEKEEYLSYVDFAIKQFPEDCNKESYLFKEAERSRQQVINNKSFLMMKNVIACVLNVNRLHNIDTDEVLKKIIQYGIDLIKQRKGNK